MFGNIRIDFLNTAMMNVVEIPRRERQGPVYFAYAIQLLFNSLRPRPNRRHFADDIFKWIFENENEWISPRISLKFVPNVRINNIPALVQIMAWRRPGDKPLSEPMMIISLTHICVARPQWVNTWHLKERRYKPPWYQLELSLDIPVSAPQGLIVHHNYKTLIPSKWFF